MSVRVLLSMCPVYLNHALTTTIIMIKILVDLLIFQPLYHVFAYIFNLFIFMGFGYIRVSSLKQNLDYQNPRKQLDFTFLV